jgi:SET domain-containing protein
VRRDQCGERSLCAYVCLPDQQRTQTDRRSLGALSHDISMKNSKVVVKNTKKMGRAVFARVKIKKGTVVAVFDGPVFDYDYEHWSKDLLDHTIQFEKRKWRDSNGLARFINHSCEPNCGIKNLFEIVAMRDILKGEQITFDYEMTEKSSWWRMRCKCGSTHCRKLIGNYSNLPRAIRKKYAGYISDWLTQK